MQEFMSLAQVQCTKSKNHLTNAKLSKIQNLMPQIADHFAILITIFAQKTYQTRKPNLTPQISD